MATEYDNMKKEQKIDVNKQIKESAQSALETLINRTEAEKPQRVSDTFFYEVIEEIKKNRYYMRKEFDKTLKNRSVTGTGDKRSIVSRAKGTWNEIYQKFNASTYNDFFLRPEAFSETSPVSIKIIENKIKEYQEGDDAQDKFITYFKNKVINEHIENFKGKYNSTNRGAIKIDEIGNGKIYNGKKYIDQFIFDIVFMNLRTIYSIIRNKRYDKSRKAFIELLIDETVGAAINRGIKSYFKEALNDENMTIFNKTVELVENDNEQYKVLDIFRLSHLKQNEFAKVIETENFNTNEGEEKNHFTPESNIVFIIEEYFNKSGKTLSSMVNNQKKKLLMDKINKYIQNDKKKGDGTIEITYENGSDPNTNTSLDFDKNQQNIIIKFQTMGEKQDNEHGSLASVFGSSLATLIKDEDVSKEAREMANNKKEAIVGDLITETFPSVLNIKDSSHKGDINRSIDSGEVHPILDAHTKAFIDKLVVDGDGFSTDERKNIGNILASDNVMSGGAITGEKRKKNRAVLQKLISYLDSDKFEKRLHKEYEKSKIENGGKSKIDKKKIRKLKDLYVKHLKKNVSDNYVDYEIDSAIDMLFPNVYAQKLGTDPMPKIVETNNELQTFIYGRPKLNDEVNPDPTKSNQKPADQEKEPMGLDMMVMRKTKDAQDDSMLSEMLGVENLLFILNQTGANTNYIKDYYYGKENDKHREKPNYQYKEVQKIQKKRVNDLLQPKKDDILSKKKYSEVGKGNAKEKYEKALSVAENSAEKLKTHLTSIVKVYEDCSFNDTDYNNYRELDSFKMLGLIKDNDPSKDIKTTENENDVFVYIQNIRKNASAPGTTLPSTPTINDTTFNELILELKKPNEKLANTSNKSTFDQHVITLKNKTKQVTAMIEKVQAQLKIDEIIMSDTGKYSSATSAVFQKNMQKYIAAFIKADDLITKAMGDLENAIKATEKYLEVKDPVTAT